jgi:uncharacterized protein YkwD
MGRDEEGLQPVSPDGELIDEEGQAPPEKDDASATEFTLTVSDNRCPQCEAVVPSRYHAGCDAPILRIGSDWKCGACGVEMPPNTSCTECGASFDVTSAEVNVDQATSTAPEQIETAIHRETNRRRRDHGLSELAYTHHLGAIALQHSRDMAQREYFSHESPDGESPSDRYRRFGHSTRQSGENLAKEYAHLTQSATHVARNVVEGWMNSPPHRENILRGAFDAEGIGVYVDTDGAVYATQNFR